MRRKINIRWIFAAALVAMLAACASQPQPAPEVTPTATAVLPLTATATLAESTPASTVTQPAAPEGDAWLLVNTDHGLWTARPDGSDGAIRITGPNAGRLIIPDALSGAVSPADGLFAYLTTSDPSQAYGNYPNLTLNIVSLLGRGPAVLIPLTSPQTEPGTEFPSDILRAMVEHPDFAWSPEGRRLAYIGADQGPSADLYEYDRETGEIVRLTDGPDQAYAPHWSPGGEWIIQTAAAGFGTGAGVSVTGFFAARADNSGVFSLYPIDERSGGEQAVGWLDDHTLVAHSWFITCGPSNLRLVDLAAPKADLVFAGCLSAVAAGPAGVLFAQSPATAVFDKDPRPGLYLLAASDRAPRLLSADDVGEIAWVEDVGAFLARAADKRLLEVSPAGVIRILPAGGSRLPVVAPGGRYWAYAASQSFDGASGIFAGDYGREPALIFSGEVAPGQMLFSPAGDALYFLDASGNLYRAQAPEWKPVLLASGLTPASYEPALAWM
jgi:hypothetical protein